MRKSAALAHFRSGSRTPPTLEPEATIRELERNHILFEAGDDKTDLFRIERGMVCVFTVRWDGRRDIIEFAFPGDIVGLKEKSMGNTSVTSQLRGKNQKFSWLDWNETDMFGTFITYPERESVPENIKEQLIVELYSK